MSFPSFIHTGPLSTPWWGAACNQSCPALCDPRDCSPSGSSVHGIFQAIPWNGSGLPFPSPVNLLDPGIKPASAVDSLPLCHLGSSPMPWTFPSWPQTPAWNGFYPTSSGKLLFILQNSTHMLPPTWTFSQILPQSSFSFTCCQPEIAHQHSAESSLKPKFLHSALFHNGTDSRPSPDFDFRAFLKLSL